MVTLIFSQDPYIAHMQGQKAYRALLKQGGQGVRLDMGESTYLDLYDECLRMPLCEGRKAIWADGCPGFAFREKISKDDEKGRAALSKLLAVPDLDFDLIWTTSCKKLDERNPLVGAIRKTGSIKEANFPSDAECHAFVRKYLSSRGVGIDDDAITEFLLSMGARDVVVCDRAGVLSKDDPAFNSAQRALAAATNPRGVKGGLADAVRDADVFIGVSAKDVLSEDMVRSMAEDAIVFAMANPSPEIQPALAKRAGARIVATGRSDHPNQINNVLAFPGIFRGALDARASDINDEMQRAAAHALAALVSDEERGEEYILPQAFDPRVAPAVASAVRLAAEMSGVARTKSSRKAE